MSVSIAIVGLPNVGKSTLFNALTDNDILTANYPSATTSLPSPGAVFDLVLPADTAPSLLSSNRHCRPACLVL